MSVFWADGARKDEEEIDEKEEEEKVRKDCIEGENTVRLIRNGSLVSNKLFVVESRISARPASKMAAHKRIERGRGGGGRTLFLYANN